MDRLTRKELKTDRFALEVGHSVEYVAEHKKQFIRWGAIAAGVVVVALVIYGFLSYRAGVREDALRAALQVVDTPLNAQGEGQQNFATQDAKNAAATKALTDVVQSHAGSKEAAVAQYYLAAIAAEKGDLATAEKALRETIANGGEDYASLAKLSLAAILQSQNKAGEGESLLRSVVDNPTAFVSKEQATIALARYLAVSKPAEARKLLEPLRTERGAISRTALNVLSEIPQN